MSPLARDANDSSSSLETDSSRVIRNGAAERKEREREREREADSVTCARDRGGREGRIEIEKERPSTGGKKKTEDEWKEEVEEKKQKTMKDGSSSVGGIT